MGQRIILLKELPSPDYLDELVARGVLRAAMTFLPGSCYAGAGVYPETTTYAMSGTGSFADACPYPGDTIRCAQWEIQQALHKVSFGVPQPYNAFVFLRVAGGHREEWATYAEQVLRELQAGLPAGLPLDYFATAHLLGCGPYNAMFEFLTADHERLQRAILRLTDRDYVEDVMVGYVAADAAKGFGGAAVPT